VSAGASAGTRVAFTLVGVLAFLAAAALWLGARAPASIENADIAPAALFAATFTNAGGAPEALGRFQGRVIVLNFWATWCAPCRAEMPLFSQLQSRWADRNVQFVGVASDEHGKVVRFGRELAIGYPLLSGGDEVMELARRLGNRNAVLPFTVVLDPDGKVVAQKVGPYTESELEALLSKYAKPMGQKIG